jgi:hypothetical protein
LARIEWVVSGEAASVFTLAKLARSGNGVANHGVGSLGPEVWPSQPELGASKWTARLRVRDTGTLRRISLRVIESEGW